MATAVFSAALYMIKTQRVEPKSDDSDMASERSRGGGGSTAPFVANQSRSVPAAPKQGSELWRTDLIQNLLDVGEAQKVLRDSRLTTQTWIRSQAKEFARLASVEQASLESSKASLEEVDVKLGDLELDLKKALEKHLAIEAKEPPYSAFLRRYAEYDEKAASAFTISNDLARKLREAEKANAALSLAHVKEWDAAASLEAAMDEEGRNSATDELRSAKKEAELAKSKCGVLEKEIGEITRDLADADKASADAFEAMKKSRSKLDTSPKVVKDFLAAVDAHEAWLERRWKAFKDYMKSRSSAEKAILAADQIRGKIAQAESTFKAAEKKYKRSVNVYDRKYDDASAEHNRQNGNPDWAGVREAETEMKTAQTERDTAAKVRDSVKIGSKEALDEEKLAKKACADAERTHTKIDAEVDTQIKNLKTAITEAEDFFSVQLSKWSKERESVQLEVDAWTLKIGSAEERRSQLQGDVEAHRSGWEARQAEAKLWNEVDEDFTEDSRERTCSRLLEDLTTFSTQSAVTKTQALAFSKRAKSLASELDKGDPSLHELGAWDAQEVKDRANALSQLSRQVSVMARTLESVR